LHPILKELILKKSNGERAGSLKSAFYYNPIQSCIPMKSALLLTEALCRQPAIGA